MGEHYSGTVNRVARFRGPLPPPDADARDVLDYDGETDDEDGGPAADGDAQASAWGVGTKITICKPEAAFGRGVIVGHHPGAHELWRVELVPSSETKSGWTGACAAPRVRSRSYFLTRREVERACCKWAPREPAAAVCTHLPV